MLFKPVVLVFERFDAVGAADTLRELYRDVLGPYVTQLQPRWATDVEQTLGEASNPIHTALDKMVDDIHQQCQIISGEGPVGCHSFFGIYDAERDAVILRLEGQNNLGGHQTTLEGLFGLTPQDNREDDPQFFLVFGFSEIRTGVIIASSGISKYPEQLTQWRRTEIFNAAGLPKLT